MFLLGDIARLDESSATRKLGVSKSRCRKFKMNLVDVESAGGPEAML